LCQLHLNNLFALLQDLLNSEKKPNFLEYLDLEFLILALSFYECRTLLTELADYIVHEMDPITFNHIQGDIYTCNNNIFNEFN